MKCKGVCRGKMRPKTLSPPVESASKCEITVHFCGTLLSCFKMKFLTGAVIDFLLYHCNLFVDVIIKFSLPKTKLTSNLQEQKDASLRPNSDLSGFLQKTLGLHIKIDLLPIDNIETSREMSLVAVHTLPLKVINLCGIVSIIDHSPYCIGQLPGEITRCGVRHRDIQLASIILHGSLQLSAAIEHVLRVKTFPCV